MVAVKPEQVFVILMNSNDPSIILKSSQKEIVLLLLIGLILLDLIAGKELVCRCLLLVRHTSIILLLASEELLLMLVHLGLHSMFSKEELVLLVCEVHTRCYVWHLLDLEHSVLP